MNIEGQSLGSLSATIGTPARKSDNELRAVLERDAVIAVGVPQGLNIAEDDPTTHNACLIRSAGRFVSLTPEALIVWIAALVPRSASELLELAQAEMSNDKANEVLAFLYRSDLLARFDRGASWIDWSKRLRVIPMAMGLGNSVDDITRFRIQAPLDPYLVEVDAYSYWNWLAWDGTETVYDGAVQVADQLAAPTDVILEHARSMLLVCLNARDAYVDCVPSPLTRVEH
jgi:hypothetical protein